MKATHKLRNKAGDLQWLLCSTGKSHWLNRLLDNGEYTGWLGPLHGTAEEVYSGGGGEFCLVKISQFKGNK